MKIESNNTGTFSKQDSVTFDSSLWAATNGIIDWSDYPTLIPYTEADVFHTQLTHTAGGDSDVDWTIRIGKGGQLYYADIGNVGQIICPQRLFSPWNDDCMTTTVYGASVVDTDPKLNVPPFNDNWTDGYIHGSGMYIKPHMDPLCDRPFYNPLLADEFNADDRSYTTINWGLVPKPSINRGEVLFYSRYRDLGNGVLELTFYCYNFGTRIYNFAEIPWWAVRPSKYPNMIEGIHGTSSFKLNNKTFVSGAISALGGWGAHTVDHTNPNSSTCCLVWGSNSTNLAVNFGLVSSEERDMALIAPSRNSINMPSGTGIYYRRYAIFGKLADVAHKASELDQYALFNYIEYSEQVAEKMPLYQTGLNDQSILSTQGTGISIGSTFPIPVKDSYPLMLMRNVESGEYFLSTDPYAICGKMPFTNPFNVNEPKYATYNNRVVYQSYDGKTEWISLLGFVLPLDGSRTDMQVLSDVCQNANIQFYAGEKLDANQLMLFNP